MNDEDIEQFKKKMVDLCLIVLFIGAVAGFLIGKYL